MRSHPKSQNRFFLLLQCLSDVSVSDTFLSMKRMGAVMEHETHATQV